MLGVLSLFRQGWGETMMEEEEEEEDKERDCRERPDMITKRIKRQRRRTLDSKDAAM